MQTKNEKERREIWEASLYFPSLDKIYIAPITIEQAIEKMKILEADFGL